MKPAPVATEQGGAGRADSGPCLASANAGQTANDTAGAGLRSWVFTIPGEPRGKGRPRFARRGNFVRTYTDEKTQSYEGKIATMALATRPAGWTAFAAPAFAVSMCCRFGIPASASAKKRGAMIGEPCSKKPDADNILKSVCDALNGIAWMDDSAVTHVAMHKVWTLDNPGVEVRIEALT